MNDTITVTVEHKESGRKTVLTYRGTEVALNVIEDRLCAVIRTADMQEVGRLHSIEYAGVLNR